ncbi:MAG: undecaprenyl-phosphate glucose phosphotransferase [Alphaproteobacteria bacterium]|nr:undecaprenyl-phosphate glucose phosphotransferase [Alphaproteobacteria bacterium]
MFRIDTRQVILEHAAGTSENGKGHTLTEAALDILAKPFERSLSGPVIIGIAQFVEALIFIATGFAIYLAYVGGGDEHFYTPAIFGAAFLANILTNTARTHTISAYRTRTFQIGRSLAAWSVTFVVLLGAVFFLKIQEDVSRVWLVSWFAVGAMSLIVYRLMLRALVLHWTTTGEIKRRTVIVGGGKDAETLIAALNNTAGSDIELLGLFDDRIDARSPDFVAGYPKLGKVVDLVDFSRRTHVDLVIVSMPLSAEKRVLEMLKQLWILPVDIRLSAHMSQLKFAASAYSYVGGLPVFDVADRPISDWNLVFKWLFDKVVALLALLLLSPLMVAVAIAIKLESPGPILFRQKRHGFNNELIEVFKFRSMYADRSDGAAARLVTRNDPRVTGVGRFIRRTSIDELPQFFNVLKDDLSIVGPRPHALEAKADNKLYYEAVDGYFARHRVKPGITGWAQIHGWRGETDTLDKIMQRVNHDLYYIENWSVFLDLYIVVMTPFSLFTRRENAY